jgi:pimeloyl-ACP methyl ester carboxylesterase
VRFDNYGHGNSSGDIAEQNMSTWIEGARSIIQHITNEKVIIVGSSMGGWIATIIASIFHQRIKGLINLAPAPDFTSYIWQNLSEQQQEEIEKNRSIRLQDRNLLITYDLIQDGQKHLLLDKKNIQIYCPVHIIHGMKDSVVPFENSVKLASLIASNCVIVKLLKDGRHNLSEHLDLTMITDSLNAINFLNV